MAHQKRAKFNLENLNLDLEVKEIIRNEIKRIKKRLDEEKNTCHQAATIGQELLKEKQELNNEIHDYKIEINGYKVLIEQLEQEKHSLAIKLKNVNLNQTMDVDTLSEKLEIIEHENKKLTSEKAALEDKIQDIQKERSQLEDKQDEMLDILCLKEKEIHGLRVELDEMKEREEIRSALTDTTLGNDSNSDNEELRNKNAKIIRMYIKANEEVQEMSKTIEALNKQLKELQNGVLDKDEEIKSYSLAVQQTKEQMEEYLEEIEMLKAQQFDENKRGNCLFSEVEDHRNFLEAKLTKESEKNQIISDKIDVLIKQNIKLKTQLNTLLCLRGQQVERNRINELEGSLSQARSEIVRLNCLLDVESKKRVNETKKNILTVGDSLRETSSNVTFNHLNVLLEEARSQLEEKEKEMTDIRNKNSAISEDLIRAQNRLYHSESHVESLKSETMRLRNQIYTLKMSTSKIENSKPSFFVEKINKQETASSLVDKIGIGFTTNQVLKDSLLSSPKKGSTKFVTWNDSPELITPQKDTNSLSQHEDKKALPPVLKASEMDTIIEPDCKQQ